jgi:hypothetical protein
MQFFPPRQGSAACNASRTQSGLAQRFLYVHAAANMGDVPFVVEIRGTDGTV